MYTTAVFFFCVWTKTVPTRYTYTTEQRTAQLQQYQHLSTRIWVSVFKLKTFNIEPQCCLFASTVNFLVAMAKWCGTLPFLPWFFSILNVLRRTSVHSRNVIFCSLSDGIEIEGICQANVLPLYLQHLYAANISSHRENNKHFVFCRK